MTLVPQSSSGSSGGDFPEAIQFGTEILGGPGTLTIGDDDTVGALEGIQVECSGPISFYPGGLDGANAPWTFFPEQGPDSDLTALTNNGTGLVLLNPIQSGALPTVDIVSGTAFAPYIYGDVDLYVPVTYTPTSGAAATCEIQLSPDNTTYTTLGTVSVPAGTALDSFVQVHHIHVPGSWHVKLTATNAVIGTGTYY